MLLLQGARTKMDVEDLEYQSTFSRASKSFDQDDDCLDDEDLSDGEFDLVKLRFASLLPKYGMLWRRLVSQHYQQDKSTSVSKRQECFNQCCNPTTSFLPNYILEGQVSDLEKDSPKDIVYVQSTDEEQSDEETKSTPNSCGIRPHSVICMDEAGIELIDKESDGIREVDYERHSSWGGNHGDSSTSTRNKGPTGNDTPLPSNGTREPSGGCQDHETSSDSSGSTRIAWDNWKSPEECLAEASQSHQMAPVDPSGHESPHLQNTQVDENASSSSSSISSNQGTVIDLVSSDDEDFGDIENSEPSTISPVSGLSNRSRQKDKSPKSFDFIDSDEDDQFIEREDLWSVSEHERRLQDEQIRSLVDRTNRITISDSTDSERSDRHRRKNTTKPKMQRHKISSFQRIREDLSRQLFDDFDRSVCDGRLAQCTSVEWSNKLRTTAGLTRMIYRQGGSKQDRKVVIELSTKVLDDEDRLRNTLLHEICHAAAFVVDGVTKPPHGECFQKWAQVAMERTGIKVTTRHDYEIQFKYSWACMSSSCESVVQRHSRSINVEKHACPLCRSNLVEIARNGNDTTKRRKRTPSAYNQFVRDNFSNVQQRLLQRNGGVAVPLADVIKECGQLWRESRHEQE